MTATGRIASFTGSRHPLLTLLGGLIVVALLLASPLAAVSDGHSEYKDFFLSGRYVLRADGKPVPKAKIYHSDRAAAYLLVADVFEHAVLILPRTGCVEGVTAEQLKEREDGGIDLLIDATPCRLGKFRLEGADVVFCVGKMPARLQPKPPLIGTHGSSELVEHSPEYARAAKLYEPDPAKMEILVGSKMEARIQIFYGTWCSFCNRFLPNTMKVEEELKKKGTKLTFEFHGLPRPPAAWATKEATKMRVRRLPTGFVFVEGRQIGVIEGNDWIRPEVSLSRIIR